MLPRQPGVRITPYPSHAGPSLGNGHHIPPHGSGHGGAYPVGRHMSVAVGIDDDCPGVKGGHPRVLGDMGGTSWDAVPSGRSAHLHHLDHAGAHQDQGQALRLHEPCERLRARELIGPGNVNGGRLSVVPATQPTVAPFQPLAPNARQHGQVAHVAHERQANELMRPRVGPEPVYVQKTRGNFRGPSSSHQLQQPEHPLLADQNRHHQPPHLEPPAAAPHHGPLPRYTCALPLHHRHRGMPSFVPVYSSYEEALEQQQEQQRQRRLQEQQHVHNQHAEQKQTAGHGHPHPPRPHQVPHPHEPPTMHNSFKTRRMDSTIPLPDRVYPARRESGAQEPLVVVAPRQDYGRETYPQHGQHADDGPRHVVRQERVLSRSHSLPGDVTQSAPPISHDPRSSHTPHQVGPPKSSVRPQSIPSDAGATRVNSAVLYPCPPARVAPRSAGSTPRDSASQVQVKQHVRRPMDPQTWNPYKCVSPSSDPLHRQGTFDRAQGDSRREETGVSMPRRRSPLMHEKSRHPPPERGPKNTADEDLVQASSSVEPSTLGDLLERGFDNVDRRRAPSKMLLAESSCPSGIKNNIEQEAPPKTPARGRSNHRIYAYEGDERDKENSQHGVGSIVEGKRPVGSRAQETLSGRKRGGEQIAKQKSFTGSYFQVSPRSFLQPNKRRRAVA